MLHVTWLPVKYISPKSLLTKTLKEKEELIVIALEMAVFTEEANELQEETFLLDEGKRQERMKDLLPSSESTSLSSK